jgi:hypothetical protein
MSDSEALQNGDNVPTEPSVHEFSRQYSRILFIVAFPS